MFALYVSHWVHVRDCLLNYLRHFPELIFEGHDSLETEIRRLNSVAFEDVDVVATTERARHICTVDRRDDVANYLAQVPLSTIH